MDDRLPAHVAALFSSLKEHEQGLFDGAFGASSVLILPASVFADHRIGAATVALVIGQNVLLTIVSCVLMLSATARRSDG